ncbi:hypothetical protein CAEBREN_18178 [Caenorhabditis brenneri]|uniref:L-Fucosyltransferase n=1 Tax=Caenorhabditis brenneri TaxID=135651 RepID=G0PKG5_CAEBE|nr:hypothetical protein CAEBREN_18178 [Caenorhabditis brenneri]
MVISAELVNTSTSIQPSNKKYLSSILAANSRLGNHLFELSSLYGLAKKLGRIPTFFIQDQQHNQMLKDVEEVMPGLMKQYFVVNESIPESIKPIPFGMKCCIFDDPERLKNVTDEYLHLGGHHYHSWKYFPRMRTKLMSFLKIPSSGFLNLPRSDEKSKIICVHIRRTDFAGTGFHMAEDDFIMNSIKFIESEEQHDGNLSTVLFGDDFSFMEGLINQTMGSKMTFNSSWFISRNTPSDDILYARHHCDVVFITSPHSTFGWWMAFLSKGNQVYYNDIRFTDDQSLAAGNFQPDDYFPPYWTPIKYNNSNDTMVVESLK